MIDFWWSIIQLPTKYEQVEDEGREIQCSDGEEIRYYDKHGNYIMSEREYEEEDDEESDESVDEDEEAICKQIKRFKFLLIARFIYFSQKIILIGFSGGLR